MPTINKIITNQQIAVNHFVMEIAAPKLSQQVKPGQFVMVKIQENTTDPLLRIPLGIHSINANGISFLYRIIGAGTKLLAQKQPSEEINILGPLGNGFTVAAQNDAVLVAGGHGVAPLYFLAQKLKNNKTTIIIGAKTKDLLIGVEQFQALGVKVEIVTEDGSVGKKGLVTDILTDYLTPNINIYACGPNPMLKAIAVIANKANIPAQLSAEAYMACGIGVCRGCAVKTTTGYKMCCKDGPVFSAEELV